MVKTGSGKLHVLARSFQITMRKRRRYQVYITLVLMRAYAASYNENEVLHGTRCSATLSSFAVVKAYNIYQLQCNDHLVNSCLLASTTLISPATLQTTAGKIHWSQKPRYINVISLRGMWHGKDTKIPNKEKIAAIWLYYMVHISPKIPSGRGRVIVTLQLWVKYKVTMLLYRKRYNPALHGYLHHYWTSWLVTFQGGHFYAPLYEYIQHGLL